MTERKPHTFIPNVDGNCRCPHCLPSEYEDELIPILDDWEPSEEEIKDHWSGEGTLTFHVLSHDKTCKFQPYEIVYDDYSGCVGGLDETLGIEYSINEGILNVGKLHLGVTYHVQGITAYFTRGDGWEIDDDVEYYVESVTKIIYPHRFIYAWYWHLIGWRIREWRKRVNK